MMCSLEIVCGILYILLDGAGKSAVQTRIGVRRHDSYCDGHRRKVKQGICVAAFYISIPGSKFESDYICLSFLYA